MNLPLNQFSNIQSTIGRVNSFIQSAGVRWTTLDSTQPSFTLPHNPSIPILNRHNRVFDICRLNFSQERCQWFSQTTTTRC